MDSSVDYIITGQGLAGTLLAWFLEQRGRRCILFDAPEQTAASTVAAGIINPITGRRFVKSWRIDDLLPFAKETYRQLEQELNLTIFHEHPLLRTLFNRGNENDWLARAADPAYQPYMNEEAELGNLPQLTTPAFAYGGVRQAAQVDVGAVVNALRERWRSEGRLREEAFDYESLSVLADGLAYPDIRAERIVFCEGWRSRFNPFFNYLPFGGNKGEILRIRLPEGRIDRMLKHRVFIVPMADGTYWIGSTSENQFDSEQASPQGRSYLEDRLREALQTPFEIVDHQAAVRPTVKDRRPFLGSHPEYPRLFIFNGLGTKGASLAPFWAKHLTDHLENRQALDPEVDIRRFS